MNAVAVSTEPRFGDSTIAVSVYNLIAVGGPRTRGELGLALRANGRPAPDDQIARVLGRLVDMRLVANSTGERLDLADRMRLIVVQRNLADAIPSPAVMREAGWTGWAVRHPTLGTIPLSDWLREQRAKGS